MSTAQGYSQYKLKIKPITPIIIGSGDCVSSGEYVLAKFNGQDLLIAINFAEFFNSLSDNDQYKIMNAIDSNPLSTARELSKYADKIAQNQSAHRFAIPVSPAVFNFIKERVNNIRRDATSELLFYTFQRTSTGAYIPGSSIKGAIRTAIGFRAVAHDAQKYEKFKNDIISETRRNRKAFDNLGSIDRRIFGHKDPLNDPFKQIKITDSSAINTYAVLEQFVSLKAGKIQQGASTMREAINPKADNLAECILTIDNRMVGKEGAVSSANKINLDILAAACYRFYKEVLRQDLDYFMKNLGNRFDASWIQSLSELFKQPVKTKFPIKLGLGTSNYSKSFQPIITKNYPKSRKVIVKGTQYLPLGWAVAEIEPLE